jgi:LysM repeat protein
VRVRAGQNLTQIARTYGTTVGALVAANGIPNPNLVVEGAVLTIPTASAAGASGAGTPSPAPTASIGSTDAVAAPGDSLWSIATRNGTTVSALARANGIPVTATILVGERLALPAPTAGGSALGSSPGLPAALLASPGRLALIPLFQQWAAHFGLPVALLEGTCWWESGWQSGVTSATGAVGIGQLEPSTVVTFRSILGDPALSAYEPSDNIEMTAAYLHQLLVQMGGSQSQALAAYYQGPASLSSVGELPSTAQYVQGVLATATLFG